MCFVFSGPPAAGRVPHAAGGAAGGAAVGGAPPAAGGAPPAAVVGYDDGSGDYQPPLHMGSSLFAPDTTATGRYNSKGSKRLKICRTKTFSIF